MRKTSCMLTKPSSTSKTQPLTHSTRATRKWDWESVLCDSFFFHFVQCMWWCTLIVHRFRFFFSIKGVGWGLLNNALDTLKITVVRPKHLLVYTHKNSARKLTSLLLASLGHIGNLGRFGRVATHRHMGQGVHRHLHLQRAAHKQQKITNHSATICL